MLIWVATFVHFLWAKPLKVRSVPDPRQQQPHVHRGFGLNFHSIFGVKWAKFGGKCSLINSEMWTANYSSSRMIAPCVQAALSRAFSLGFMSGTNAVIITEWVWQVSRAGLSSCHRNILSQWLTVKVSSLLHISHAGSDQSRNRQIWWARQGPGQSSWLRFIQLIN